jgi:hypothetical protein
MSSGTLYHVTLVRIDVLENNIASIFRVPLGDWALYLCYHRITVDKTLQRGILCCLS